MNTIREFMLVSEQLSAFAIALFLRHRSTFAGAIHTSKGRAFFFVRICDNSIADGESTSGPSRRAPSVYVVFSASAVQTLLDSYYADLRVGETVTLIDFKPMRLSSRGSSGSEQATTPRTRSRVILCVHEDGRSRIIDGHAEMTPDHGEGVRQRCSNNRPSSSFSGTQPQTLSLTQTDSLYDAFSDNARNASPLITYQGAVTEINHSASIAAGRWLALDNMLLVHGPFLCDEQWSKLHVGIVIRVENAHLKRVDDEESRWCLLMCGFASATVVDDGVHLVDDNAQAASPSPPRVLIQPGLFANLTKLRRAVAWWERPWLFRLSSALARAFDDGRVVVDKLLRRYVAQVADTDASTPPPDDVYQAFFRHGECCPAGQADERPLPVSLGALVAMAGDALVDGSSEITRIPGSILATSLQSRYVISRLCGSNDGRLQLVDATSNVSVVILDFFPLVADHLGSYWLLELHAVEAVVMRQQQAFAVQLRVHLGCAQKLLGATTTDSLPAVDIDELIVYIERISAVAHDTSCTLNVILLQPAMEGSNQVLLTDDTKATLLLHGSALTYLPFLRENHVYLVAGAGIRREAIHCDAGSTMRPFARFTVHSIAECKLITDCGTSQIHDSQATEPVPFMDEGLQLHPRTVRLFRDLSRTYCSRNVVWDVAELGGHVVAGVFQRPSVLWNSGGLLPWVLNVNGVVAATAMRDECGPLSQTVVFRLDDPRRRHAITVWWKLKIGDCLPLDLVAGTRVVLHRVSMRLLKSNKTELVNTPLSRIQVDGETAAQEEDDEPADTPTSIPATLLDIHRSITSTTVPLDATPFDVYCNLQFCDSFRMGWVCAACGASTSVTTSDVQPRCIAGCRHLSGEAVVLDVEALFVVVDGTFEAKARLIGALGVFHALGIRQKTIVDALSSRCRSLGAIQWSTDKPTLSFDRAATSDDPYTMRSHDHVHSEKASSIFTDPSLAALLRALNARNSSRARLVARMSIAWLRSKAIKSSGMAPALDQYESHLRGFNMRRFQFQGGAGEVMTSAVRRLQLDVVDVELVTAADEAATLLEGL